MTWLCSFFSLCFTLPLLAFVVVVCRFLVRGLVVALWWPGLHSLLWSLSHFLVVLRWLAVAHIVSLIRGCCSPCSWSLLVHHCDRQCACCRSSCMVTFEHCVVVVSKKTFISKACDHCFGAMFSEIIKEMWLCISIFNFFSNHSKARDPC